MSRLVKELASLITDEEIEKIKELYRKRKDIVPYVITIQSFFKDTEWVDYLLHTLDFKPLTKKLQEKLKEYFEVFLVSPTTSLDFIIICGMKNENLTHIEQIIEKLEKGLIDFFLSDNFLGKIQKAAHIFQNPFKNMFDFSVGFCILEKLTKDEIYRSIQIATTRAKLTKESKFTEISLHLIELMHTKNFETHFQPMINTKNKDIYAYEALARGPENSPLRSPEALFKVASYNNIEMQLDTILRRIHLSNFKQFTKNNTNIKLSLNLAPFAPMFIEDLINDIKRYSLSKEQVILEISEKTYIDDFIKFSQTIDLLKKDGFQVAVDDFGAGITTLKLMWSIATDIIKIDRTLVNSIEHSNDKQTFLDRIYSCFSDNITLIVEGVETTSSINTLQKIGYAIFQGFKLFKPSKQFIDKQQVVEKLQAIDLYS